MSGKKKTEPGFYTTAELAATLARVSSRVGELEATLAHLSNIKISVTVDGAAEGLTPELLCKVIKTIKVSPVVQLVPLIPDTDIPPAQGRIKKTPGRAPTRARKPERGR
jgi:hypothetical protein